MYLKELLTTRQISKANSNRASILELMLEEINKERKEVSGYYSDTKKKWIHLRPMTAKILAIKIAHVKTEELRDFHQTCVRYGKEKGGGKKEVVWSYEVRYELA